MTQSTGQFSVLQHRGISRNAWLTARAPNAVKRPIFISAVGIGTFVAVLVSLRISPFQSRRTPSSLAASHAVRPDTALFATAASQARARLASVDSALAQARAAAMAPSPGATALNALTLVTRDSLSA